MNTQHQIVRLFAIVLFMAFILSSCSKDERNTILPTCEIITINITNNLDDDISNLDVEGENIGTLKAGETHHGICLDQVILKTLNFSGTYNDNFTTSLVPSIGFHPIITEPSIFNIGIESVQNDIFSFSID